MNNQEIRSSVSKISVMNVLCTSMEGQHTQI